MSVSLISDREKFAFYAAAIFFYTLLNICQL